MRNRRSYIDSVNAGRERRQHTPLGDLNRTLQGLEERLDKLAGSTAGSTYGYRDSVPNRHAGHGSKKQARRDKKSLDDIAREIERARSSPRTGDMIQRLTSEVRGLKSNLRQEMAAGLRKEFDVLRRDIEKTYVAAMGGNNGAEITSELDRIGTTIRELASQRTNDNADGLRADIEELKHSVEKLAREDTLRAVDNRWGEMDRRFDAFEQRISQSGPAPDYSEYLDRLYGQLEQISGAIDTLPDSLPIRKLEDRVQNLAEVIESMSTSSGYPPGPEISQIEGRLDEISNAIAAIQPVMGAGAAPDLGQIEDRLDEISRAVASVGSPVVDFDNSAFDRIETRLTDLMSRLDDMDGSRDEDLVIERINSLAERVESLAASSGNDAPVYDDELYDRLASIAERLDSSIPSEGIGVEAIESRLNDILAQFENSAAAVNLPDHQSGLEERLDEIVRRLEQPPASATDYDGSIIERMEGHLAALSEKISSGRNADEVYGPAGEFDRETVLETARLAAVEAVNSMPSSGADTLILDALTGDLKELEQLARRSDERNSKTFEAIHDTLLKIVDRLGALEQERSAPSPEHQSAKMPVADVPPIDGAGGEPLSAQPDPRHNMSPAAAAAAAAATVGEMDSASEAGDSGSKSMFGGLSRAFSRKRKDHLAGDPEMDAGTGDMEPQPIIETPEIDADLADQPLEPGSGAPDLSAIMKRVQEEKGEDPNSPGSKTAQADFIAAARRAAQAAAAEAEIMKKGDNKGEKKSRFAGSGSMLGDRRKVILMGATAVMILLAGYQLGSAFLGGGSDQKVADNTQIEMSDGIIEEQPVMEQDTALAPLPETDAETIVEPEPEPSANVRMAEPVDPQLSQSGQDIAQPAPAQINDEVAQDAPAPSDISTAALPDTPVVENFTPPPEAIGPAALRDAATSGNAIAMFEVGARYAEGRGVTQDLPEAAKWYERAANKGLAPAQYRYGNMLEKGTGVERDITAAKNWYQMAAQQGNASAMHNLAVLYAMGAGGAVDNDSAARWFIEAAELGVTDSQFNLGILAAKGVGVPQDLMESYKWFALAGKAGDKDALKKRDEVANALRPEQLEKARVAAELWKVKAVDAEANSVSIPDAWTESGAQTTAAVDMEKAVKNIQLLLIKNGFNPGAPDGVMGKKTTDAIKAYQKANDMPVNGQVDEVLVRSLLEKNT